jgi:polyisoprenoid-binding protein YceI
MRFPIGIVVVCVFVTGCGDQAGTKPNGGSSQPVNASPGGQENSGGGLVSSPGGSDSAETASQGSTEPTPVPIESESESGVVVLTPENTKIEFVGTHVGDPNPRTGVFEKFSGKVEVDLATKSLKFISVEIETDSLWTPIERLTVHLKSTDFFEVREYPTASFQSTKFEAGDAGQVTVSGSLTLHGQTKRISFPATVSIGDDGLTLNCKFSIDRTKFGMDLLSERVESQVSLAVAIGEKTQRPQSQAGGGRGGGGGGRRGSRGGFDPAQFFASRDADKDGKLSGDEISERMREDLDEIDKDGDGAISLEEFQARMQRFGGGRGKGRRKRPDAE